MDSILRQSFKDFEVILVDDGSTDTSGVICDRYAKQDTRVRVIHKNNMGMNAARKDAILTAKGDFSIFVDSDDYIEDGFFEDAAKLIQMESYDLLIYRAYELGITGDKKIINQAQDLPYCEFNCCIQDINKSINLFKLPQALWAKVFKTSIIKKYMMLIPNRVQMGEDGIAVVLTAQNCKKIYFSSLPVYYYRQNPDSVTKNRKRIIDPKGALIRIRILDRYLIRTTSKSDNQISAYASHALINVARSHFRNYKYFEARRIIKHCLEHKVCKKYFRITPDSDYRVLIAHLLLKYRCYLLIKLISII